MNRECRGERRPRVAAYIRVSTDSADQENSYENQERYFRGLLSGHADWISAGIYSDAGLSGTSAGRRAGFQRLLRHCGQGRIDRIVCKSISRFARNTADFLSALRILEQSGVTILFEKEGLDTADPTSGFILTALAAIAQEESRSLSANVLWSVEKRFPQGDARNYVIYGYRYAAGGDAWEVTPTGYRRRRVAVEGKEAAVVRRVFDLAEAGWGFAQIARRLNSEGVPAPGKRPAALPDPGWTGLRVARMVRSERYCGDALLQKTFVPDYLTHQCRKNRGEKPQYYVQDHHPAIIGRDQFDRVQRVLAGSAGGGSPGRRRKALTHRLFCPHCGRYYHSRGGPYALWRCPTAARRNGKACCPSERVYEEQILRVLRRAFIDRFDWAEDPASFVDRLTAGLRRAQDQERLERDLRFLQRQIDALEEEIAESERRAGRLHARLNAEGASAHAHAAPQDALGTIEDQLRGEERWHICLKAQREEIGERYAYLKAYGDQLERDEDAREEALRRMEALPPGRAGAFAFLNGLTVECVQAFALRVIIHDPRHCTVHWYDDTRTEVEMSTDVEDHRLILSDAEHDRRLRCG
ncbi:MAG: recombinase family protein [Clostridia bacterium]|nr:recombinase family protein [Clostridia bacterium]